MGYFKEAVLMLAEADDKGKLQQLVESGKFKELLNSEGDEKKKSILSPLGTVPAGANEEFKVDDKFVVGTNEDGVRISYLGDNFRKWFGGKTVNAGEEAEELHRLKLEENSLDKEILDTLGGLERAETTLGRVYALMRKQPNGEEKEDGLLTNRYANIFYVNGYALYVYWRADGWYVVAYAVSFPIRWNEGYQVLSRNPIP